MILCFLLLLGFDYPEIKPCVVDKCENETCTVETPEGLVEVRRKPGYYEGKELTLSECPINQIEPT